MRWRAGQHSVPVPRRWPHRARQQPGRAGDSARRARTKKPSVRRLQWRRRSLGHHRLASRHGQAQRCRALRLHQGCPRAHDARPSDAQDRRSLALELESLNRRDLTDVREMNAYETGTPRMAATMREGPSHRRSKSRNHNHRDLLNQRSALLRNPFSIRAHRTKLKAGQNGTLPTSDTVSTCGRCVEVIPALYTHRVSWISCLVYVINILNISRASRPRGRDGGAREEIHQRC